MAFMKVAITSDIHFPMEITRQTILYTKCGYLDDFYDNLLHDIKSLSPQKISAFIICGDFFWDYRYFIKTPYVSPDWSFYNGPITMLRAIREGLHEKIPLIFMEGNHDLWFQRYIHAPDGNAFVDIDEYIAFLGEYFKLNESQCQETVDLLAGEFKIGNNMYFLKKEGIFVRGVYIYGLNFYNKEKLTGSWPNFKKELAQQYYAAIESFLRDHDVELPLKVILCQHEHPVDSTLLRSFSHPSCEVKAFFWGHNHGVSDAFIKKLSRRGPYRCVMPEKNGFKIVVFDV